MIPRKSNKKGGGGLQEGLREMTKARERLWTRTAAPHELYNTNFSVWECIIIIGVGVGARWGGSEQN